jgi:hypothetical protein
MRSSKMSVAALAVSAAALFVAAGGTSWASSLISGSQIKNATITSEKIGPGQVKNVNLGSGAVTASKVASGSLTASDLPPNTFLPANGTAVDSNELGGKPPSAYVHGSSSVLFNRILVGYGQSQKLLLDLGIGEIDGNCSPTGVPQVSFTSEVTNPNMIEWATNYPGSGDINTANALAIGDTFTAPYVATTPQAVTFQVAYNGGPSNHVATAWTTAQNQGGTAVCLFTGEALTTG